MKQLQHIITFYSSVCLTTLICCSRVHSLDVLRSTALIKLRPCGWPICPQLSCQSRKRSGFDSRVIAGSCGQLQKIESVKSNRRRYSSCRGMIQLCFLQQRGSLPLLKLSFNTEIESGGAAIVFSFLLLVFNITKKKVNDFILLMETCSVRRTNDALCAVDKQKCNFQCRLCCCRTLCTVLEIK